jgi:hypothetical protein
MIFCAWSGARVGVGDLTLPQVLKIQMVETPTGTSECKIKGGIRRLYVE